jgi:hypothetical protein
MAKRNWKQKSRDGVGTERIGVADRASKRKVRVKPEGRGKVGESRGYAKR